MFKHAVDSLNISVEQLSATGAAVTIPLAVLLGCTCSKPIQIRLVWPYRVAQPQLVINIVNDIR